jgi:putative FmdB family regulatory protein
MPIYEFVCRDCNTVYQFFSKRVNPEKVPVCPKEPGHSPLERVMSRFAMGRSTSGADPSGAVGPEEAGESPIPPGLDDPRAEAKMMDLMSRMEGIDERDGRAMGRMMRELAGIAGEGMDDPAMQETIRRLESGEDPEKVEEIVSDAYGDAAFGGGSASGMGAEPSYDGSLYDM